MTPRLALVIVNYNAGTELRAALQSFVDDARGQAWEAVVVDNASQDGSAEIAQEFGPCTRLVKNQANVGFARAVNQGVAVTTAPVILVMNPDSHLVSGALAALLGELDAHARCAIAAPRVLDPDGSPQGNARGDPDMLTGLFGRTGPLRALFPAASAARRNVVDEGGAADGSAADGGSTVTRAREVDWVSGACMLIRRDAFDRAGGFDPRYFMYWEDADLCRRLRGHGYEIRYVPAATAVHRVGHSSRTAREASIRAFHTSAYLYYTTHVARGALDPRRLVARLLLGARCWWRLRWKD